PDQPVADRAPAILQFGGETDLGGIQPLGGGHEGAARKVEIEDVAEAVGRVDRDDRGPHAGRRERDGRRGRHGRLADASLAGREENQVSPTSQDLSSYHNAARRTCFGSPLLDPTAACASMIPCAPTAPSKGRSRFGTYERA